MNPRLHLAMHEIVATQLWDDSPPEVWDTAVRLLEAGYEQHEVLHMLAGPVVDQVWGALHDERAYDRERHLAALRALPGSWERERTTRTAANRHDDAPKQARRAARTARRQSASALINPPGRSDPRVPAAVPPPGSTLGQVPASALGDPRSSHVPRRLDERQRGHVLKRWARGLAGGIDTDRRTPV